MKDRFCPMSHENARPHGGPSPFPLFSPFPRSFSPPHPLCSPSLQRHQIFETDLVNSIDSILFPDVPLALRLSGQLLLGVVRVFARKVAYLHADANDALSHIRHAFAKQLAQLDLPQPTANASQINIKGGLREKNHAR